MQINEISGGVTRARGFKASSAAAGIKYQGRTDMAMVYSEKPCTTAGTFTSNMVKAAPVLWDRELVNAGKETQAIVVNSGIANAGSGKEGMAICEQTAEAVAEALGIAKDAVLIGSTGVIGPLIPMDRIRNGICQLVPALASLEEAGTAASRAIMTTDTVNKEYAVSFTLPAVDGEGTVTVYLGGMSKGSGMIHPNMCTMLGFLTTDLSIEKSLLQEALSNVIKDTFNMITVDGDTSTNDTLLILANGLAENQTIADKGEAYHTFYEALFTVCRYLARRMAGDGEGASKLFEAKVVNARSKDDARTLSRAIVGSNLSKAAIYGCDANFGRFLCAMGYSGAQFDQNDVELFFESKAGRLQVFDKGTPLVFDEELARKIMEEDEVTVFVDMHEGEAEATAWGCDLTYDYVKINADYRS